MINKPKIFRFFFGRLKPVFYWQNQLVESSTPILERGFEALKNIIEKGVVSNHKAFETTPFTFGERLYYPIRSNTGFFGGAKDGS
jgi:hypothetical protein